MPGITSAKHTINRAPSTREEVIAEFVRQTNDILARNLPGAQFTSERIHDTVLGVITPTIVSLNAEHLGQLLRVSPNVGIKRKLLEDILARLKN